MEKRLFQVLSWAALIGAIACSIMALGSDTRYAAGSTILIVISIVFSILARP